MRKATRVVALREAAYDWAASLRDRPTDQHDSGFKRKDAKLQRAARLFGMAKRGYSREFTPQTDRRVRFEVDRIPPTLMDAVKAKAKRQGVSIRALTLRLWKEWVDRE